MFFIALALAAASLIVILVCRSNRGTVCSKALKKEIKTALLLEKRLYLLNTQEAAPSLAHTVAQLCRERVRVCDSASAAVRRAQNEGMRLSGALWRRVYGACREFLRKGAENDELALLLGAGSLPAYALCALPVCLPLAAAELLSAAAAEIAVKTGVFADLKGELRACCDGKISGEELAERVAKSGEKLYQVLTGPEMCENIGLTVRIGEAALEKNGCRKENFISEYSVKCTENAVLIDELVGFLCAKDYKKAIIAAEKACDQEKWLMMDKGYEMSDDATRAEYRRALYGLLWDTGRGDGREQTAKNCVKNSEKSDKKRIKNGQKTLKKTHKKFAEAKTEAQCVSVTELLDGLYREGGTPESGMGYYLLGEGQEKLYKSAGLGKMTDSRRAWVQRIGAAGLYIAFIVMWEALTAAVLPIKGGLLWAAEILNLPLAAAAARAPLYAVAGRLIQGKKTPMLREGAEALEKKKCVIAMSCILSTGEKCRRQLAGLERMGAANPGIPCVLVGDFLCGGRSDSREVVLQTLKEEIERLNERGSGFAAVVRLGSGEPRERKRGALEALSRYLVKRDGSEFGIILGGENIAGREFILAADQDTVFVPGCALTLMRAALHPLSKRKNGKAPMIQPSVTAGLPYRRATALEKALSDGMMPFYPSAGGELLCKPGYSPFGGKGLFEAEAYLEACAVLPQGRILSHDQAEGDLLGCIKCPEAEAAETVPETAEAYLSRRNRWIRGDWQNLLFLAGRREFSASFRLCTVLNCVDSVKELFVCTVPAILLAAAPAAFLPAIGLYALFCVIPLLLLLAQTLPAAFDAKRVWAADKTFNALAKGAVRAGLETVFLPCSGANAANAVGKALWRSATHSRRLLQWSDGERASFCRREYFAQFWAAPFFGLVLLFISLAAAAGTGLVPDTAQRANVIFCCLLCAFYGFAPVIYYDISQKRLSAKQRAGAREDRALRVLFIRTLRFFYDACNNGNRLPPDNYQQEPYKGFCTRTSVSNIGFALLALACGMYTGLLPAALALEIIEECLFAAERLEKYRGCHYNWYDVKTGKRLGDFVSAVDCGNYCACLLAASGLIRTAAKRKSGDDETGEYAALLIEAMTEGCEGICADLRAATGREARQWILEGKYKELKLPEFAIAALKACAAKEGNEEERALEIAERMRREAEAERLELLFDGKSGLFCIGINAQSGTAAAGRYDLFASENLLCSYTAIALGRVPAQHWFRLGRRCVRTDTGSVLLSWSGTVFESLMPLLFLEAGADTLAGASADEVIRRNIVASRRLGTPYGISESCCGDINGDGDYSYSAFGLPCLALDGKEARPIFAPYASVIGMEYAFKEACENLEAFTAAGAAGKYGMYESADYRFDPPRVVKCCMAHHQGMIIAGLCNALWDGAVRQAFMSRPDTSACRLLLCEEMPAGYKRAFDGKRGEQAETVWSMTDAARLNYAGLTADIFRDHFAVYFEGITLVPEAKQGFERGGHIYFMHNEDCREVYWEEIQAGMGGVRCFASTERGDIGCDIYPLADGFGVQMHFSVSAKKGGGMLLIGADMLLAREEGYYAHPQYNDLFPMAKKGDGAVVWTHREGAEAAAGIICSDNGARYYTSRQAFYQRGSIYSAYPGSEEDFEAPCGAMLGVCVPVGEGLWEGDVIISAGYSRQSVCERLREYEFLSGERLRSMQERLAGELAGKAGFGCGAQREYLRTACALLLGRAGAAKGAEQIRAEEASEKTDGRAADIYATEKKGEHISGPEILYGMGISGRRRLAYITVTGDEQLPGLEALLGYIGTFAGNEGADVIIAAEVPYEAKVRELINGYNSRFRGHAEQTKLCGELARLADCAFLSLRAHFEKPKPVLPALGAADMPSVLEYISPGFCAEGYMIKGSTPRPWCNILAQKGMGSVVAENGSGYTFGENARLTGLTRPADDPVRSAASEIVYIEDEDKNVWTVTSSPIDRGDEHAVLHGFGKSVFYYDGFGIEAVQTVFIEKDKPRKHFIVQLKNVSGRTRHLRIGFYADAFIGESYRYDKKYCIYETAGSAAVCRRGGRALYLTGGEAAGCDSRAFLGSGGLCAPEMRLAALGGDCLCAVKETVLEKNAQTELCFSLCLEEAGHPAPEATRPREAMRLCGAVVGAYAAFTQGIRFGTGIKERDALLSDWLAYQVYNSRFIARCGYYQHGGAAGFRDQLQDCLCLMYYDRQAVRRHIIECAQHQYIQGDVQHWWHDETLGVRTHISDDRLWLPYVAARFAKYSGDMSIFDEEAYYLEGEIRKGEHYGRARVSGLKESLYMHCVRAFRISMTRGEHGLPLIGGGDWNDAMNEVGKDEKGESVWLGWFTLACADMFEKVAASRGDEAFVKELTQYCRELLAALEENAWEKDRYLRAFTASGEVLGSRESRACRIDSISQAWAAISGFADKDRAVCGIRTAYRQLKEEKKRLVRLLAPPFTPRSERAGYINDYPPGIRENGGQYTHGAVWLAKAFAISGFGDEAWEILEMISPLFREEKGLYGNEPYVLSADIYADGRGGWSWYTGAAGWYFTTVLEDIFGVRIAGDRMDISPCFPSCMQSARLHIEIGEASYEIRYHNPPQRGGDSTRLTVDGQACADGIAITPGEHRISVIV